jgi:hypothetical protein
MRNALRRLNHTIAQAVKAAEEEKNIVLRVTFPTGPHRLEGVRPTGMKMF